ncbi:MAG: hypothetical protein ACFFD2_19235 [Promethearchaeota archaeon]
MIKLNIEKDVKQKHKIQCPHCLQIIDLISQIQISQMPGGLHLSIKLWNELKELKTIERGLFQSPTSEMRKSSMGESEIL